MNRIIRNTGFYIIIFLVTVGIVSFISRQNDQSEEIRYDEFRASLASNQISEITSMKFDGYTYFVTGKYLTSDKSFTTRTFFTDGVADLVEQSGVPVTVEKMQGNSVWVTLLTTMIPFIIIFVLFFFMLNQSQGGGGKVMNFG